MRTVDAKLDLSFKVRHTGKGRLDELRAGMRKLMDGLDRIIEVANDWNKIGLSADQMLGFAKKAIEIKGTTLAIETYQAAILQMTPPSGRIDPGIATYYALAARPLVEGARPVPTGHFGEVPADVADAAVASRNKWTVPASVTVAQWAVESAWGASMPPGSNNPFGIKAVGDQPAVESPTREVINGESIKISARFGTIDFAIGNSLLFRTVGWFKEWRGTVSFDDRNAQNSGLNLVIKARSVQMFEAQQTTRIKDADYLDVGRFADGSTRYQF